MSMSLKEKIHNELLKKIIKNEYSMKEFLNEGNLAKQFGVSKAPVREALIQLCNEGIIRSIPRSGYQIIQLTERDIWEATQFRIILEIEALKLYAHKLQDYQIQQLEDMTCGTEYTKLGKKVSLEQWWENNAEFHITLSSFAKNTILTDALSRSMHLLWRAVTQLFWNADPYAYLSYNPGSHVPILDAIKQGDTALTENLLRSDILSILKTYSSAHTMKL